MSDNEEDRSSDLADSANRSSEDKCEMTDDIPVQETSEENKPSDDDRADPTNVHETENEGADEQTPTSLEPNAPKTPGWSFAQWSGDFESVDDEKVPDDIQNDPEKAILWAAEKNEVETVRKLLEEDPSLVNARDENAYTPLHRACYNNNVEVLKVLLSYDADLSAKTEDDWEPLHCACKWDSVEAVSLLLQNGANVNSTTKGNLTPLHLAASNASGRRTLELLLWQPYVNATVKNDAGDTAYDVACRSGPMSKLFEILDESLNVY